MEGLNLSLAEVSVELLILFAGLLIFSNFKNILLQKKREDIFTLNKKTIILITFFLICYSKLLFFIRMQFSFFGSVLTIGGLVGAALSGRFADLFGRRGVSPFSHFPDETNLQSHVLHFYLSKARF